MGAGALGALGGMVEAVATGAGLLAVAAGVLLVVIVKTESRRNVAQARCPPILV